MLKKEIAEGKLTRIIPRAGGGLTGEVHLLRYKDKKCVVRRCKDLETAENYQKIYKKLEKYGFLPRFLGRQGNDVCFEYIDGRHLRKDDPSKVYEKIGKIAAQINRFSGELNYRKIFGNQLKEIETGKYVFSEKVRERRRINNEDIRPKKVFSAGEVREIRRVFNYLDKKCRPKTSLDGNDFGASNFLVDSYGRVFFVDIEGIRPKVKGFGISKARMHLAKKNSQREALLKGYSSVSSAKFLTEEYMDFLDISFLIQKINYRFKIYRKEEYEVPVKKLKKILAKYK